MENVKYQMLKKYFGYDNFRDGQEQVIDCILSRRDVLCIMPTGAGKSVCYQIPALMFEGVTIVVSPLISLMKDQVQFLVGAGVRAAYVNSSLTPQVIEKVLLRISGGLYKIIYVAPERLNTFAFMDAVCKLNISQIVVDESHCISKWGHDFRPSYLGIVNFVASLKYRPVISAFTATATDVVKGDICSILNLKKPLIKVMSFDRPNLYFDVRQPKDKQAELIDILKNKRTESGIIYCATRKTVEDICHFLNNNGFLATRYHAGLEDEERAKNQDDFIFDKKRVMVATNAFGMGIDKGNVSYVIHYNMPRDMESYYQEAGRAGRDGNRAECILLFGQNDVYTQKFLIEHSTTDNTDVVNEYRQLNKMIDYCKIDTCLRQYILGYFGEEHGGNCHNCGNCNTNNFVQVKIYNEAYKIVDCIRHLSRPYGANTIAAILCGSKDKKVMAAKLYQVPEYASLKGFSRRDIVAIIDKLVSLKVLIQEGVEYPVLIVNEHSYIDENITIALRRSHKIKTAVQEKSVDENLFNMLKSVRLNIAQSEGVPAYIIFSDSTLKDMCKKLPKTEEEFLNVSGVGEIKCNRYSSYFIKAIKSYH
jgi:ATP-dependent DNA helicase RecQ